MVIFYWCKIIFKQTDTHHQQQYQTSYFNSGHYNPYNSYGHAHYYPANYYSPAPTPSPTVNVYNPILTYEKTGNGLGLGNNIFTSPPITDFDHTIGTSFNTGYGSDFNVTFTPYVNPT